MNDVQQWGPIVAVAVLIVDRFISLIKHNSKTQSDSITKLETKIDKLTKQLQETEFAVKQYGTLQQRVAALEYEVSRLRDALNEVRLKEGLTAVSLTPPQGVPILVQNERSSRIISD